MWERWERRGSVRTGARAKCKWTKGVWVPGRDSREAEGQRTERAFARREGTKS